MNNYVDKLKFFCNKVLPLVYDETLSYYELLCKVTAKLNEVIDQSNSISEDIAEYIREWLNTAEGQEMIADIISEIIDEQYSNLVTRMDAVESDVDTLQTNVTTLNTKIKRSDTRNMEGSNIVFFGDSWTVGRGAEVEDNRFSNIVARALKMNQFNYGILGGGFAISNKIQSGVTQANNEMTATQKNNTSLVLITGGVNDARNWDAQSLTEPLFYNGVDAVIDAVHNVFPNALICLACGTTVQYGTSDVYKNAVLNVNRNIQSRAYPVKVINNVMNFISNTAWYKTESSYPVPIHPNDTGHKVFADYIINALVNGGCDVCHYVTSVTFNTSLVEGVNLGGEARIWRMNDLLVMKPVQLRLVDNFTGNNIVGTVPRYLAPEVLNFHPMYYGNHIAGECAIATQGNFHVMANNVIPTCYIPLLQWKAF